jgi:hypothetical protein
MAFEEEVDKAMAGSADSYLGREAHIPRGPTEGVRLVTSATPSCRNRWVQRIVEQLLNSERC